MRHADSTPDLTYYFMCVIALGLVTAPRLSAVQVNAKMDGVTDESAVLQQAIDDCADGGLLTIPAGTMSLSRLITVSNKSLTIRGEGAFATRLRWTAKGGMSFSDTKPAEAKGERAAWEIADIRFEAGVAHAGTALLLAPRSARVTPSIRIHNCDFQPARPGGLFWDESIDVRGGHLGQIASCYFRGNADPQATTQHHIRLSGNSTAFQIADCHGQHSIYGILAEDETEGVLISKCFFVQNAYGYAINIAKGGQPMFDVVQSHAASSVYPLWMVNARSSSINGNLFVLRGDEYASYRAAEEPPAMIRIDGSVAKSITIIGNALQMNDKDLKGPFVGIDVVTGRDLIVMGNTIAHNFASGGETGIRFGSKTGTSIAVDNIIALKDTGTGKDVLVDPKATDITVRKLVTR